MDTVQSAQYAPDDHLCQARLRGSTDESDWQTFTFGTARVADAWRRQVAPRLRRMNYETRTITGAQANAAPQGQAALAA